MPVVHTPVNYHLLRQELSLHPDQKFVEYLCDGLEHGFDTLIDDCDVPTKECKNLRSATTNPDVVDTLIDSEVDKGFLHGPFDRLPFSSYRVSPIGVAFGKYSGKPRLIVDLSSPHEDHDNQSVNEMIDKELCSLSYVRVDDAIEIIKELGRGTTMCKTDISDAFKLMPIRPDQWHMHCIKWREKYFFYTQLVFGSRSSAKIFDTLSKAVCWVAQNNYGIKYILHLLDDFLTLEHPDNPGQRNMDILFDIFNKLNIPMALHKTIGPVKVIEFLGLTLDSDLMQCRLPRDKLDRIRIFLNDMFNRKTCTKREVLQLLGHLNFAARVVLPGRSFVSYLIKLSTTVKRLHYHVKLNDECREDIKMWLAFLTKWNGINFFYNSDSITSEDMCLYTDASMRHGFGGYFQGKFFSEPWPEQLKDVISSTNEISIAFCELYPIVVATMIWGHLWTKFRIVFMCDNQATCSIINKGRSKSIHIMPLVRRLTMVAIENNFTFRAEYFPGRLNDISDSLSRLQIDRFRRLAPNSEKESCRVPDPETIFWTSDQ